MKGFNYLLLFSFSNKCFILYYWSQVPCLNESDVDAELLSSEDRVSRVCFGPAVLRPARLQPRRVAAAEELGEPLLPPEGDPVVDVPYVRQGPLVSWVRDLGKIMFSINLSTTM